VEAKEAELAAALRSDDPQRVAEACDSVAVSFQQEWALGQEVVAAVRRLSSPAKKAARLAGALRRYYTRLACCHPPSTALVCCPLCCLVR
jgi:hypothetical protein